MFSFLWNPEISDIVEEISIMQLRVMESTKLKTQQNAFLASRGHKQNPATIQDLKWPGKDKARSCCCCRSTSGSFPQLPALVCRVRRRRFSCLNMEYTLPCSRVRLLSFLLKCFWGVCSSQHQTVHLGQRAQDTWKELSLAHLCLVNVVGNMPKDLLRHQTPEETLNLSWAPLNHLYQARNSLAQFHPPSRKLECHD